LAVTDVADDAVDRRRPADRWSGGDRFADLVAIVLNAGRRPNIQEAWIATTARAHDVAAYTPGSDFEELPVRAARV
jgi:predicted nucleic acid-binding protein